MRIAITGGTGFVGRHLARALAAEGHAVVILARGVDRRDPAVRVVPGVEFHSIDLCNEGSLAEALAGCYGVAHCAGINRETGAQTYDRVHVQATCSLIAAAKQAGVAKVALLSFLRARPACGSPYHESKWAAEEIVRASGLDYTVLKAGIIYGAGDHMLDHLSHALHTFPLFFTVGLHEKPIRPVAVEDVVRILRSSLVEGALSKQAVGVVGPEEMLLSAAVGRLARVLHRRAWILPLPTAAHYAVAMVLEALMRIPLISRAQVRMLAEGIAEPWPPVSSLPEDLMPRTRFDEDQIRRGLPRPEKFGRRDLRISC